MFRSRMLVCPSLSFRSLGSAPRCSSSHLCSESEIQMEGAPSTELHQVPSAGLHRLSPGRWVSCLAIAQLLGTIARRSERLPQASREQRGSDCRHSERSACSVGQGIDGSSVSICRGPTLGAIVMCLELALLIRSGSLYLFPWGARQCW